MVAQPLADKLHNCINVYDLISMKRGSLSKDHFTDTNSLLLCLQFPGGCISFQPLNSVILNMYFCIVNLNRKFVLLTSVSI